MTSLLVESVAIMLRFVIQVFLISSCAGVVLFYSEIASAKRPNLLDITQKIDNPQVKESYNRYRASEQRKKLQTESRDLDKNGTDLALRKVSLEVEQQLYAILWNIVFATAITDDTYGPNALKMFGPELIAQMVTDARGEELGEIAESIYEHLKRERDGN
jgi:hypothetical protein